MAVKPPKPQFFLSRFEGGLETITENAEGKILFGAFTQ